MAITAGNTTTNAPGGGDTALTLGVPAGVSSGDLLVALVTGVSLSAVSLSAPAGWVEVVQEAVGTTVAGLFYRVAGGSEPASYDFGFSDTASNRQGGMAAYSGVDGSTPGDAAATENTGNDDAPVGLGLTTATDGAFVLMAVRSAANVTFTAPAGMDERLSTARAELFDVAQGTAGASGNKTAGMSASTNWIAFLWALKPAGGGGAQPVTVSASPGVVSLVGQTATVSSPIVVAALPGQVTATGQRATVKAPIVVAAAAGVVVVGGLQASIVAPIVVVAGPGVVQVVGQGATVVSGAVRVQAAAGVVQVVGVRAVVDTARFLYDLVVGDELVYVVGLGDGAAVTLALGDEGAYTVELVDSSRA